MRIKGDYIGMKCPQCGSISGTRIIDSRSVVGKDTRRRRHLCEECKTRFTTYEITAAEYDKLQLIEIDRSLIKTAITALQEIETTFAAVQQSGRVF